MASRTRNDRAASAQMTAAATKTGGYPNRASILPEIAAIIACAVNVTRKLRADALLRSSAGALSIKNVNIPGSVMYCDIVYAANANPALIGPAAAESPNSATAVANCIPETPRVNPNLLKTIGAIRTAHACATCAAEKSDPISSTGRRSLEK